MHCVQVWKGKIVTCPSNSTLFQTFFVNRGYIHSIAVLCRSHWSHSLKYSYRPQYQDICWFISWYCSSPNLYQPQWGCLAAQWWFFGEGALTTTHIVPSIPLSIYCEVDVPQNNAGGWRWGWRSWCRTSPKAASAGDLWQPEGGSTARHQWHPAPHSSPVCVCYSYIGTFNEVISDMTCVALVPWKALDPFFVCLILSGAIPAWSWCCGGHQTIPSAGSEKSQYRNSANNRQYQGNPRLRVHLPPLTVPPVPLQTHTLLCTASLWPTALERRTWKCNCAWWLEKSCQSRRWDMLSYKRL